jgi:hypothetical protein
MNTPNSITSFLIEWASAERSGDVRFLEEAISEDFIGIGPLGFQLSKEAWIARHRGPRPAPRELLLDDAVIRAIGTAVIVTAEQRTIDAFQGHVAPAALKTTLVLSSEQDAWRLAGIHMSFIAGTPGSPPLPGPTR